MVRLQGPEMAHLVPLLRTTFRRRDFTAEWLKKKYSCKFNGLAGFACVALAEEGQAVAALGVLPWPIRFGNRTELAAQMVDGATHHTHRRRGLLTRLGEIAQEVSYSEGVSFLFGFAHTQAGSYPALVRNLGYRHIDDLIEYRLPIRTLWTKRLERRFGPMRRFSERHLERVLGTSSAVDPVLENSLLSEGFAGTDRDRPFYDYKSFVPKLHADGFCRINDRALSAGRIRG